MGARADGGRWRGFGWLAISTPGRTTGAAEPWCLMADRRCVPGDRNKKIATSGGAMGRRKPDSSVSLARLALPCRSPFRNIQNGRVGRWMRLAAESTRRSKSGTHVCAVGSHPEGPVADRGLLPHPHPSTADQRVFARLASALPKHGRSRPAIAARRGAGAGWQCSWRAGTSARSACPGICGLANLRPVHVHAPHLRFPPHHRRCTFVG